MSLLQLHLDYFIATWLFHAIQPNDHYENQGWLLP